MEKCYDVVIVGAGISGLTSAHHLLKKDPAINLLVLEAKDRVGGRTLTVPLKTEHGEDLWDMGGQWVGRSQPHIMKLLRELNIDTYQQYITGTKFSQFGDFKPRTYETDIPSLSIVSLLDLQNFLWKIEEMRQTVSCHNPWSCPNAQKWDSMTLATFTRNTLWTKGATELLFAASRTVLGMEPTQFSLLFFLMYLDSSDGIEKLTQATEFAAQEYKLKGGAQQISVKLAEKIDFKNIELNKPVVKIYQNLEKDIVTVTTGDGITYKCKHVILAVPPPILGSIQFEPMLPGCKLEIIRHMPKGNMCKVIITYQQPFWKERGYSGEVMSNGGTSIINECNVGPISAVFDSTSSNNNPALVMFISGDQNIAYYNLAAEVRKKCVLHQLSVYWGGTVYDYIDYKEHDWNQDPYIVGAPVCCLGTGVMKHFVDGIRIPFHRIHFGSTETATQWCGYLSGAVQSGLRTATEVLQDLRPDDVTTEDLEDSGIVCIKRKTSYINGRKWIKVSLGFGGALLFAYFANRYFRAVKFSAKFAYHYYNFKWPYSK